MISKTREMLLDDWDNRPSSFWVYDNTTRLNNEIKILKALLACGCRKTRDGLSVQSFLDACQETLRAVQQAQREVHPEPPRPGASHNPSHNTPPGTQPNA